MLRRNKLVRWLLLVGSFASLALVLLLGTRVYLRERSYLTPPRGVRLSPQEVGVQGLRSVEIPCASIGVLRGWFAPSENGAAVVLTHGAGGDRSELVPEIRILTAAGYGVLAFDWPGHGLSDGHPTFGPSERRALRTAIRWLEREPTVDPQRIGAFGFSMGGYVVAQVAAEETRLKAVTLAGTAASVTEQLRWEYRHWGPFSVYPALWSQRLLGIEPDVRTAARMVTVMRPRPLLVVGGQRDPSVRPELVEQLYRAARQPKRLLMLEKAAHGGYAEAAPERYPAALRELYSALLR